MTHCDILIQFFGTLNALLIIMLSLIIYLILGLILFDVLTSLITFNGKPSKKFKGQGFTDQDLAKIKRLDMIRKGLL